MQPIKRMQLLLVRSTRRCLTAIVQETGIKGPTQNLCTAGWGVRRAGRDAACGANGTGAHVVRSSPVRTVGVHVGAGRRDAWGAPDSPGRDPARRGSIEGVGCTAGMPTAENILPS
jgi:hypothetical protein